MQTTSLAVSLDNTKAIEVTAEARSDTNDREVQIQLAVSHQKILELDAYAAMDKNKRWKEMQNLNNAQWNEYQIAVESCDNPMRKKYLQKMIKGNRARQQELIQIGRAISS